ncbi:MAG TPA: xanthine dehydrogenase small subunit [Xanthomonadales bacterium]|nr:xanthine dehydrogenase small subunit [Xanthomonadales bacterium]
MMRSQIDFILGDHLVSVSDIEPETTVLEWLRSNGRVGTKEGCAEGDCGACTVVVAEQQGDTLSYKAINSCIQPMVSLDGRQLITVEDLARKQSDGRLKLHPVQQAMVDHHGSQCGFCTPGFVMSMFAMTHDPSFEGYNGLDNTPINQGLAGNLCRCTGYAPIVRASRKTLMMPETDQFDSGQQQTIDQLESIRSSDPIRISAHGRQLLVPRTQQQLLGMLSQYPEGVPVAGATDVGLWLTKELKQFETMIYLGEVEGLSSIEVGDEYIEIGATASYTDAMPILCEHYPDFREMLTRLGGLQVRNAGTIGGNIANGSPIGDMPPPLMVLRSKLVLTSSKGSREIDLEDFFIEYGTQDLQPGEFVHKIRMPLPQTDSFFRVYKVSKRSDQDITAVLGAFVLRLKDKEVQEIRIAYGGMAGVPARATAAEKIVSGAPWDESTVAKACEALTEDFKPLSDWRASADYRMLSARNLLKRLYLETSGENDG